jgi:hypothetical protein
MSPQSTTYFTPLIVTDVYAIFVAKITLLGASMLLSGVNIKC